MVVYVFSKFAPAPKVRVGEFNGKAAKPSTPARKAGRANGGNGGRKLCLPKQFLVKTPNTSYLVYHFENLNFFVKAKPVTCDIPTNYQPNESELTKISEEQFEAIKQHFEVIA